jgi:hypothetical protein
VILFVAQVSVSCFRVFKKGSPNGKITVYLGKRDFVDHITHVDPIGKFREASLKGKAQYG